MHLLYIESAALQTYMGLPGGKTLWLSDAALLILTLFSIRDHAFCTPEKTEHQTRGPDIRTHL